MKASKLKRYAEEWQRIEIAVEEAERTGSLQAVSDLLEKECATARREALEDAAQAAESIILAPQMIYCMDTVDACCDAIRVLIGRTPASAEARENGEGEK